MKASNESLPQRPKQRERARLTSAAALLPTVNAATVVGSYARQPADLATLVHDLRDQCEQARRGDLQRGEAMLVAQAHSLDAIFANLARRAALNAGKYLGTCDTYLRLALKAQSQCRATWETLAAIKNPPVVFAKQANIANGPQQINNAITHAETVSPPTELLRDDHGKGLDTCTKSPAIGADPFVATVGQVHGAKIARR